MFSSKEEILTEQHELKVQLEECSKKIDALRKQKSEILGLVGDNVAESLLKEG